ncbi:SRPBCC family protein [Methylophilus flavus]|uniref:SRPBCC family protein n=1 Tax=Methylophilus flavus TaxID=640084 RepID=A0ABW3PA75_9PROT
MTIEINPELDLILEREVDVSPEEIWHAWTTPEHLKQWFCPLPWKTVECEMDLTPGGRFHTVMQSPEGQQFPNTGCYLELIPNKKLSWTNALEPGFRPAKGLEPSPGHECAELLMTASIVLEATATGTRYTAYALHTSPASKQRHEAMGFQQGWSMVLDQLVAVIKQSR